MSIDNYQHSRSREITSTTLEHGLLMHEQPPGQQHEMSGAASDRKLKSPSKHPRLVSLDMVRGLTMAVMVLVDEIGGVYPKLNHSPWNNVTFADFVMPWFLFMVGVSMAFSLRKYQKVDSQGQYNRRLQREASKKIIIRSFKLYFLGIVLQGGDWIDSGTNDPSKADYTYGWNLTTLRFCGILNRIAWAYLTAGLAEVWIPPVTKSCRTGKLCASPHIRVFVKQAWHWVLGFSTLVLYLLLTFFTYVPDWISLYGDNSTNVTIKCNKSGWINTPECSAASYWDRTILGQAHLGSWMSIRLSNCSTCSPGHCALPENAPAWCTAYMYDPEGLLASIPTVLSTLLGVHFGRVLKAPGLGVPRGRDDEGRNFNAAIVGHWTLLSIVLIALGLVIHFAGFKMNKQLWSPSYLFFMAGTCGAALIFFYIMADWRNGKWTKYTSTIFRPLQYMGMNAILLFFFHGTAEGIIEAVYIAPMDSNNVSDRATLLSWFYTDCLGVWYPEGQGHQAAVQLTFTLTKIFIWFVVCYILFRANYFWKI